MECSMEGCPAWVTILLPKAGLASNVAKGCDCMLVIILINAIIISHPFSLYFILCIPSIFINELKHLI